MILWSELPRIWAEAWSDAEAICERYELHKAHALRIESDRVAVYPRLFIPRRADLEEHTRLCPTHRATQASILQEVLTRLATDYPIAREVKFLLLWAGSESKAKELITFTQMQGRAA